MSIGQTVQATPAETNAQGQSVAIVPGNLVWNLDNLVAVSFVVDPQTGVATFTALAPGTANVVVSDVAFGLTSPADQIIVSSGGGNPTALTFTFGQPGGPGSPVAKK
jgi:hypothetical protein